MKHVLQDVCSIWRIGYGKRLPGVHDEAFIQLAELYVSTAAGAREELRAQVPDDCRLLLLGFGNRLATVASRTSDKRLAFLALVAHSIEDFKHDERENMIRMAIIHHVARKLGVATDDLFERVARLSSEGGAAALRKFVARPEASKSLRAMRIVETMTDDGVDYEYRY